MNLTLVTPPASEPVTLAQAKLWLRVTDPSEDDLVADLVTAARERCEAEVSRSFLATGWRLELDAFPGMLVDPRRPGWTYERDSPGPLLALFFPRARVTAVTSVTYLATDGTVTTLDPSLYQVQLGDAARLAPAYGRSWPATRFEPGAVKVSFTAGYGTDPAAVPSCVRTAVRVMLAHMYTHRGSESVETPQAVRDFLSPEWWGQYS